MINSYDDLSPVQLDVLKEIGNIGSGNAATALSQLLGRSIDMQVPQVRLMDVADAIESLGSPDKLVVGILIRLKGDADGMIMFLLEEAFAKTIVTGIMGERSFSLYELNADDISVLSEIGREANVIEPEPTLSSAFVIFTPFVLKSLLSSKASIAVIPCGIVLVCKTITFLSVSFTACSAAIMIFLLLGRTKIFLAGVALIASRISSVEGFIV